MAITLACGGCARGCHDAPSAAVDGDSPLPVREATRIAPLGSAVTTESATLRPTHARAQAIEPRSPSDPAERSSLLDEGWGVTADDKGEAVARRAIPGLGPTKGSSSPTRTRILRMVHITDTHLVDDESPTRLADYDGDAPFNGAFRPQEGYSCKTLDAAVRTINRLHADAPFDFVLFGGDNIDSAQENELTWLLGILDGGSPVSCDSGRVDDPLPGPSNDPKDPFVPQGLKAPWYWVTGNHDVLVQGTFAVDVAANRRATGDHAGGGTRDYARPGAPITRGSVVADSARALLGRDRLFARIGSHAPADHASQTNRSFYTVDVGARVRLLVVDSAAETGGAGGVIRRQDVDQFVTPELARAVADRRWVIVAAHHAVDGIGDGSSAGNPPRADAVTSVEWEAVLTSPPVVAVLAGHGHRNRIRALGRSDHPVWEIQSAALADYPSTFRIVELWTDGDALSLRTVSVDYAIDADALAAEARTLSVLDWTTGWSCCGPGDLTDRNVELPLRSR